MKYVLKVNLALGNGCLVMHRFIPELPPGVTVGCDIFDGTDFMEITSIMWYPESGEVCVWVEDADCLERDMVQSGWIPGDLEFQGEVDRNRARLGHGRC